MTPLFTLRDTMARMIGTDNFSVHKINAAYNIGGAKMAMRTTSKVLNVPIKYYISMNMGGMRKIVDGVGGVTVTPPLTFTYDGYTFTKGKTVHLNGSQALAYSRMRYDDPKGDYGRQLRQREVIMSVLEHALSFNTLKNLDSILGSVSTSLRTNLTFDSMVKISKNYRKCTNNMSSDYLHGVGAMIGDASYQVMSDRELQRTSNIVRNDLGLDSMDIDNNETYQNSMNSQFDWNSGDSNQVYYIYDPYTDELWNGDRATNRTDGKLLVEMHARYRGKTLGQAIAYDHTDTDRENKLLDFRTHIGTCCGEYIRMVQAQLLTHHAQDGLVDNLIFQLECQRRTLAVGNILYIALATYGKGMIEKFLHSSFRTLFTK